ncbi:DEAD/DEAH box helicase [Solibacillus sp. A46]|uniref:DEAD/DEAH box helicase n=1 Tax=Solibacillus faecavium TaxID=2762221 RepID=A0ABR8XXR8_9BACL|nr:DEAD/DEAH box helicase [Solibacillus faecavium]MBD8036639.1 DEAD/DEAH box helicase [Solibacillus faecavium]
MTTPYHAKYFANELTRITSGEGIEKLSQSLFDANVDLNPHQIEAALFAFKSPLSKGVLLADEVGLGKTIEAGLVLCQYWAERKRKLIIICPASLRKQWSNELEEKFNLPTLILESSSFNRFVKEGMSNPFNQNKIIITSFQFANRKKEQIRLTNFDLVVIDEAHKLRNVYQTKNRLGKGIKWAIEDSKKILLTATPLQNSLMELYGLSTLIDDHLFGDVTSFRNQYVKGEQDLNELRDRLKDFTNRTLRSQVQEYIRYTERKTITVPFTPADNEYELYQLISEFLLREDTYAIPKRQRVLTTLILRKLLASSSYAIANTLKTIKERLLLQYNNQEHQDLTNLSSEIIFDDEMEYDILEELEDETEDEEIVEDEPSLSMEKLKKEIEELEDLEQRARIIRVDSKSKALLTAIETGFKEMASMDAKRKVLIFTESKRTQQYLKDFLESNGYANKIVLFNGTNTDVESKQIYEKWLINDENAQNISGSKTADKRQALIDHFKNHAEIMIATESAAEGVNLQFCSLIINYDLPWNPQRIEQRIGRCHRYGQKHDVVVINFLNKRNEADIRVLELLQDKFNLFAGVLGASDEVLGTIESGVDFEKRILSIYQQCRTPEEINIAFKQLQDELEDQIKNKLDDTHRSLLEHFDEDVHQRLKMHVSETVLHLDRFSQMFWNVTSYMLKPYATFDERTYSFEVIKPIPSIENSNGNYQLKMKERSLQKKTHQVYRLSHPIGETVLEMSKLLTTECNEVIFNISNHPTKISVIENLKGQQGYLILKKLTIVSYQQEEYLLFNGFTIDGQTVEPDIFEKMFNCNAVVNENVKVNHELVHRLKQDSKQHVSATVNKSFENNHRFFNEERERLEKWADDMMYSVEKELQDLKVKIKEVKRKSRHSISMEEQHKFQKELQELEKTQRRKRQQIFEAEDEIAERRDDLINELENQMIQTTFEEELFIIKWRVV